MHSFAVNMLLCGLKLLSKLINTALSCLAGVVMWCISFRVMAMLSVVIMVVCFVCYCCHRSMKKRSSSIYRQQWLENEANMDIYSVEQCYDIPAGMVTATGPGAGSGPFFLDNATGNEYQSLPTISPHHPNGPPPSYDAVLAHDEMAAEEMARRKSCEFGAISCNRGSTRYDGLLYDSIRNKNQKRSQQLAANPEVSSIFGSPVTCDDIWRNGANTNCHLTGRLQLFCRKCCQIVDSELMQGNAINIDRNNPAVTGGTTSDSVNDCARTRNNGDNFLDCVGSYIGDINGNMHAADRNWCPRTFSNCPNHSSRLNELLQDFQFHSAAVAAASNASCNSNEFNCSDCTNNNDNTNNETGQCSAIVRNDDDEAKQNEEKNNNLDARAMSGSIKSNSTSIGVAVDSDDNPNCPVTNNINSPAGVRSAHSRGCRLAADRNGNEAEDATMRNLAENGVIRLDMSQIIDQTGLPTYEAALKLESSGYV
ncbi:uncharacterized protein DDB_G0283357 isoform X2 [Toxorhynchites rutilus septentrionalis]|uniref:uncharacterized protein DDB_G0283357 isoform X2 n=1 Tax=Toxorhynchites rutilus septentrionalis TaxID=329112 RepID=UPI00247917A2|nr:uncharacterized protein DDB_G0283357 isoform X2 [Toxorhynchites rutilus septentrionalis]